MNQVRDKKFIECDGVVCGTLLSQLASVGGVFSSVKAKEEWVPKKIYYKCSNIGEMTYYPEDRKFVERFTPPARMPNILNILRGVQEEAPEENVEAPPQEIITYAPAGWYFTPDWTRTQYHIARDEDAEALANSSAQSDVARALDRLADEIALKPSASPGSEFLAAQNHFYNNTN